MADKIRRLQRDGGENIPVRNAVVQEPVFHSVAIVVLSSEQDEDSQPGETNNHLAICNTFATLGNQEATISQIFGLDRLEHGPFNKTHVVSELQGRADEKPREVRTGIN